MKRVTQTLVIVLLLAGVTTAHAQNSKPSSFDPLMTELVRVKWISNHDPGFGSPNEFYKLSKQFLATHTRADFLRMLNHFNPIVRAMGLLCLAQKQRDESFMILLAHTSDETVVRLSRGCLLSEITIGEFAKRLLIDPDFLDS